MLLSSITWSRHASLFFTMMELETIEQLAEIPAGEISRYRHLGKKTITEIRYQLGKFGLHLKGDNLHFPENITPDFESQLAKRKTELEGELAQIEEQIQNSKTAKWLKKLANRPVRERLDENAIYEAWKNGSSFTKLAKEFSTRNWLVSKICWSRLEKDCSEGNPPPVSHTIQKRINCKNCKTTIVIRYKGEPNRPKCSRCGRQSKYYFQ